MSFFNLELMPVSFSNSFTFPERVELTAPMSTSRSSWAPRAGGGGLLPAGRFFTFCPCPPWPVTAHRRNTQKNNKTKAEKRFCPTIWWVTTNTRFYSEEFSHGSRSSTSAVVSANFKRCCARRSLPPARHPTFDNHAPQTRLGGHHHTFHRSHKFPTQYHWPWNFPPRSRSWLFRNSKVTRISNGACFAGLPPKGPARFRLFPSRGASNPGAGGADIKKSQSPPTND